MKVAVFGLGFVGLTTALGFADKGFEVRGYDTNTQRCAEISRGHLPFFEPGLDEALARHIGKTFLVADSALEAVEASDVCFVCVGTPGLPNGSADLTSLLACIDSVSESIPDQCVLIVKSTVPPGTVTEQITPYVRTKGLKNPVAVNPEFLREGMCWEDFMHPDRVVCGVSDDAAEDVLLQLYAPFHAPVHLVEPNTAEFIKYLSNSLLATMISYSNEMSLLADAVGSIDTARAFHILHEDKRLAGAGINSYIYPGCGYGGYCLPKDTAALAAVAQNKGIEPRILNGVISLNEEMPERTAEKIARAVNSKDSKIGILGLSFKPGSDDVRDSPAAKIISALIKAGYDDLYVYDPIATEEFRRMHRLPIYYAASAREVCEACDTVALVTAWAEFGSINKEFPETRFIDCRYFLGKA
ncbi:UDP-glucose dehydrogenase family protein [Paenibacillus mesotrionivorans]|uniref:UDP-glucose dehydrogenase family protein n=1 Tax=Paenibacillus mesotrionivorans TaxID=3160968 RepID=A0ACC7P3Z5_9BACL